MMKIKTHGIFWDESQVNHWRMIFIIVLFFTLFCKPSDLENANDLYSQEFGETQILLCLLKGPICSLQQNRIAIRPLVHLEFNNASLANSGPVTLNFSSQEWSPNWTTGKDGDVNGGINFNTNNRYYSSLLGEDASLPLGANPRTLCAWIKPSQLPTDG